MDIIAHSIWGWIYTKFTNSKLKGKIKIKPTILCSILPDLIAFTPLAILITFNLLFGTLTATELLNGPHSNEINPNQSTIFYITTTLYTITHSLFVFLAIFFIMYLIYKKPILELTGWLIHILIDIPTHSYQFYPTPFLWPISNYIYDGISWGQPILMTLNYTSIIICLILIKRKVKASLSKNRS